jgi:type VI secretion system protein ImpK
MSNPYFSLVYPFFFWIKWFRENPLDLQPSFRQKIINEFESFDSKAIALSCNQDDIRLIKYALVAYIDELLCTSASMLKDSWVESPLQLEWYNEHTAGEGFFERLQTARININMPVIEIYYICLVLGFRGKYILQGESKRLQLKSEIQKQLRQMSKDNHFVTINTQRSKRSITPSKKERLNVFLLSFTIVTLLFMYVFFYCAAEKESNSSIIRRQYSEGTFISLRK